MEVIFDCHANFKISNFDSLIWSKHFDLRYISHEYIILFWGVKTLPYSAIYCMSGNILWKGHAVILSGEALLVVPPARQAWHVDICGRAFSLVASLLWNSLLLKSHPAPTLAAFPRCVKTD